MERRNWRSDPRYRTKRWLDMRMAQLINEPLCRYCAQLGRETPACIADHVIPHRGDEFLFWSGELQSLCESCHNSVKHKFELTGVLKGSSIDGIPLDPKHHWNQPE